MDIHIADQRVLLFDNQISLGDAQIIADTKKIDTFGTVHKFTSFLSKPKTDDFELIYQEHRFQPFWHVISKASYLYDRTTTYQIQASSPEVKAVTLHGDKHQITNQHFHLKVIEHCDQVAQDEKLIDGLTGKPNPKLKPYFSFSPHEITKDLAKAVDKQSILVPPQIRVSGIMRDSLARIITGIQADKIISEQVEVTCMDLYYHPIYAFKYRWKSKNLESITEIDGITGEIKTGNRTFSEYFGKILDKNFLFDVGADAAGMLIPGGSIAVKVAKKYLDDR